VTGFTEPGGTYDLDSSRGVRNDRLDLRQETTAAQSVNRERLKPDRSIDHIPRDMKMAGKKMAGKKMAGTAPAIFR
jgi:hypothetical protein